MYFISTSFTAGLISATQIEYNIPISIIAEDLTFFEEKNTEIDN